MKSRAPFRSLFKIIIYGKSSMRLFIAAIISLGFSISVILATMGLMDGFSLSLKKGLRKSNGDLRITSREGFFKQEDVEKVLNKNGFTRTVGINQIEAFFMFNGHSKGIVLSAVDTKKYEEVTNVNLKISKNGTCIGKELAKDLGIEIGDSVSVVFARGNKEFSTMPIIENFTVTSFVDHGIYEKDLRYIYINHSDLEEVLPRKGNINNLLASFKTKIENIEKIKDLSLVIEKDLELRYNVKPYWVDFSGILKAVEVEKLSISLVLQIIVIVSIFNIAAFIIFITEKKAQAIFLIRALGLNSREIGRFWLKIIFGIWFFGCILSIYLTKLFNFLIMNMDFFKVPGKVYILSALEIVLTVDDYILIFSLTFAWVFIVGFYGVRKLIKKSILSGLRQEFN